MINKTFHENLNTPLENPLNKEEILQILLPILSDIAPEMDSQNLDLTTSFREQIHMDSYDFYQMIEKIEDHFEIRIPDSSLIDLTTLEKLIHYIFTHRK